MKQGRGGARLVLGLMSGTSHDGIDAALLCFSRKIHYPPELIHHTYLPYPPALRVRIASCFEGSVREVCELNAQLGERFALAALQCVKEANVPMGNIDAIASHGQTVYHIPPKGKQTGSTLQIGEPSVIAQRTGVRVVANFRAADMAEGGHGAPLVPLADYIFFRHKAPCAVHNIGGISNLTAVMKRKEDVYAFDTGPGCSLMDEAAKLLLKKPYDRDGRVARSGSVDHELLRRLMRDSFFRQKPPKSTGRERYGREMVARILKGSRRRPQNVLCTLAHLTARSIARAYERFVFTEVRLKEIILAGGGSRNKYLVGLIRDVLKDVPVTLIDDHGIPASAKEAASFAILANETIQGRTGNLPRATGARKAVVLGSITKP